LGANATAAPINERTTQPERGRDPGSNRLLSFEIVIRNTGVVVAKEEVFQASVGMGNNDENNEAWEQLSS